MEKVKHNLVKEEYMVSLLGYKLVQVSDDKWAIIDQNGDKVGYTEYETPPYLEPDYRTCIYKNGVRYDNSRSKPDNYFHYEFTDENGTYTIVIINLDGDNKEIEIWRDWGHCYRLNWRNVMYSSGFELDETHFNEVDANGRGIQETNIVKYIGDNPSKILCNGKEINGRIVDTDAPNILRYMDKIMRSLPFVKSLREIIGEEDIRKCGMKDLFDLADLIRVTFETLEIQKDQATRRL